MPLNPAGQMPTMGSTSLPPMPGQAPGPQAGLSSLLGPTASQLPQTGPSPQEAVQAYMGQIRQLHMGIDALAQQHPEAAEDLNIAKNSLTNSMSKVATAVMNPQNDAGPMTF